jgi:cell division protein FtsI/penicillin-binding protein 2
VSTLRSVRIIVVLLLFLIVVFLFLGVRCFYLQYYRSEDYKVISLRQQQVRVTEQAQRGVILDSRGSVLAASDAYRTIFAEPRVIRDPKEVSEKLQPILDMGAHKICQLIGESGNPGYVKLKSHADVEVCSAARGVHHGIGVEMVWERHYPSGRLLSSVVGFTSVDNRGLSGIELQYDKELRGRAGQSIFLADAFPYRRPLRLEAIGSEVADGWGIILTIDSTIQQFVHEELLKVFEEYEAESAAAIVMEPKTGAIISMLSLPDFDPSRFNKEDKSHFRNRAISDSYEPGSVLKPIVAAIGLDEESVNRSEKIYCEDGHYAGKGFGRIREYGNHRFGNLTVRGILVNSSNIGMAKIGQRLGKSKLYRGMKLFGFGKRTEIDLPGEEAGLLRDEGNWTGYSVTRIPFGQEISVTSLQLLRAFCILANGGKAVRPFIVRALVDNDGDIVKLKRPKYESVGYIVSSETARWLVTDALVGVVKEGTGKRAALERWQVFGKTGTANIAKSDSRGYSESAYIASFVGGAPAQEPKVVVLVSVRKPNVRLGKGYTGGTVAAPVVGRILERTLSYLERR